MDRRHALCTLTALPLVGIRLQAFAAPASGCKFLLVFLRGGLDTTSVVVPVGSEFYYRVRPNIAIGAPGTQADGALPLDSYWGLHPALRETLMPLYAQKQVAFVAFAGTDDVSRSHFETQDSIELGQGLGSGRDFGSGFLNRLASVVAGMNPIAFTEQLPLCMRGEHRIGSMALQSVAKPAIDPRQRDLIASMYAPTRFSVPVGEGFAVREEIMRDLADEADTAGRGAVLPKGFERDAQRMGKLLSESFDLGFIDVGGWDTHVGQGGAKGYLANRLDELGRGLAAFAAEMGPHWRDTTVVLMSEFGRTMRENGNRGTDHGHGTTYILVGGAVRGGRFAGEQQEVTEAGLFQKRDLPVLNEYRAVLGGLFARLYGLRSDQLERVFPGAHARDLQLV
ncbi:MAG TPA: DUF1501 domain-containing protein [Burkholderiaceae bacterium]|nr:DUF1501 domain-containing protein [Burkholderiaceae bacterium]